MRTTLTHRRVVHLASHRVENNVHVFDNPVALLVDCMPTNSESDVLALGINHKNYQRIITDVRTGKLFKELDKVWVDVAPPDTHDKLAKTADYFVYSVMTKLRTTQVLLKRANADGD